MKSEPQADRHIDTGRIVMRPHWHHLLFLHWAVAPEQLRPFLPPGLELDLYEGRAYAGLIPFTMTGVRPVWAPRFPGRFNYEDFHEINVRTYVRRAGGDPGVWFFSLDAANALAVRAARVWYKLPYHYARISLTINEAEREEGVEAPIIDYSSERLWPGPTPATCAVRYRPTGVPAPAQAGTLEHFLVERYILYSYARGHLFSGRVHHAPYSLQGAELHELEESLVAAAGITHGDEVPIAYYAREVDVEIFGPERVE
ncbi:MAG: DUF2071 domain-containing protein [Armatimonadota bacterium]|nr:DUF2071 domain-containing protein [Armatimonadota bacterium]